MQYIWIVTIDGETDNYYFSTAEKAYGYLVDRISSLVIDVDDSNDEYALERIAWYGKQIRYLTKAFEEDESAFGCSYGWVFKAEVN